MNEPLANKFEAILRDIKASLGSDMEELFIDRIGELKQLEVEHLKALQDKVKALQDKDTLKAAIKVMCSDL